MRPKKKIQHPSTTLKLSKQNSAQEMGRILKIKIKKLNNIKPYRRPVPRFQEADPAASGKRNA